MSGRQAYLGTFGFKFDQQLLVIEKEHTHKKERSNHAKVLVCILRESQPALPHNCLYLVYVLQRGHPRSLLKMCMSSKST